MPSYELELQLACQELELGDRNPPDSGTPWDPRATDRSSHTLTHVRTRARARGRVLSN